MKAATYKITKEGNLSEYNPQNLNKNEVQLALCFGEKNLITEPVKFNMIKELFPNAEIVLGSTSGEIFQDEVNDHTISIAAMKFDSTPFKALEYDLKNYESSYQLGREIYKDLEANDLRYIFLLADGNELNASELLLGIDENNSINTTGGLAGDGIEFQDTKVGLNKIPEGVKVVAIGFYGDDLLIGQGSYGGWEEFGLSRTVTKSKDNELFEVDNQNILDLYKRYLGKYAEELPGSALLFPLSLQKQDREEKVVRTILGINEQTKSLIFGGDIPEGSTVRLMKSNKDNIIDAASKATTTAIESNKKMQPKLALLISCVGRKVVLNQRVEEEIDEVNKMLDPNTAVSGFYSYGEISPLKENNKCELHNQTMTITLFDEVS